MTAKQDIRNHLKRNAEAGLQIENVVIN